jgi:hypothetical protein
LENNSLEPSGSGREETQEAWILQKTEGEAENGLKRRM